MFRNQSEMWKRRHPCSILEDNILAGSEETSLCLSAVSERGGGIDISCQAEVQKARQEINDTAS